jgi:hypothetical protein
MSQESHPSRAGDEDPAGQTHGERLRLGLETGYVGDALTLQGEGLPASQSLDVVWHTVDGRWQTSEANEVIGQEYEPTERTLKSVTTDPDGTVEETLTIPEDYGGEHTIELRAPDGNTAGEATLTVRPHFELDRREAPLGESFRLSAYGLGPGGVRSNYQVAWDNGTVGLVTGVENRGTAHADVRAVGPVGEHVIQVRRGHRGVSTLQDETQSPYGEVAGGRQSTWTVEVTEPESEPATAWMDPLPDEQPLGRHLLAPDEETDAELSITPTSGQPGTTATLAGENFPANTEVDLVWYRHEHDGNHVMGLDFTPVPKPDVLPTVETDDEGAFETDVTIPRGEGSTRPITAEVDGRSVAVTGFMMQSSIVDITPTEGPVGTEVRIEISGIGWTEYEKHVHVVYDNTPVGHICGTGFDFDRDEATLWTVLRAAGEPGWHFIDIYPTISEMETDDPDFEITPILSHEQNAPVRPFPAMHLAFKVTE